MSPRHNTVRARVEKSLEARSGGEGGDRRTILGAERERQRWSKASKSSDRLGRLPLFGISRTYAAAFLCI